MNNITKHEWSDRDFYAVDADTLNIIFTVQYPCNEGRTTVFLNKSDATAIARHFNITEADYANSKES